MRSVEGDSSFFSRTIAHEASPIQHEEHPDLDLLLASLEGDIVPELQSKLSAHIATCEGCRAKWRKLADSLHQATQTQMSRSRAPTFDVYLRERIAPRSTWVEWLRSLFEVRTVAFVAASAAAVALVLAVAVPLVRQPVVRTSQQIETLDERVANLQNRLDVLTQYSDSIPYPVSSGITVADLMAYDWQTLVPYVVQPTDSWEGIAEQRLGNADLWPLIWLLNRDVGPSDAPPPWGTSIWLPTPWPDS